MMKSNLDFEDYVVAGAALAVGACLANEGIQATKKIYSSAKEKTAKVIKSRKEKKSKKDD